MTLTEYICLHKYGRNFLGEDEISSRETQLAKAYHRALGLGVLRRHPKEFWDFQNYALGEIGITISRRDKFMWAFEAALDLILNPKQTIERLISYRKQPMPTQKVDDYMDI